MVGGWPLPLHWPQSVGIEQCWVGAGMGEVEIVPLTECVTPSLPCSLPVEAEPSC